MTETVPPAQSSSLRRLVPRIFSRSARRDDVEQLLRTVRTHHPKGDLSIIERAYAVADQAHAGQERRSGEPYITHPLAVAQILADLGLGPRAIAAALLHDTVEDTGLRPRHADGGVRRRGRDAGRRRHEARQGQVRRERAGRDRPQDDRRDVARHPRAPDQARRPAPQRADVGLRPAREGAEEGHRDARDLRSAGASARHPDDQVGARGPVVRRAAPEALRRDRESREAAHAAARAVRPERHRSGGLRSARASHPRARDGSPQAAVLRVPEDGGARPRVRRHLRPHRHPHPRRQRARLLRRPRRDPRAVDSAARPVQGLHRDAEVQPLPVAAHDRDRAGRAHGRDPDPHQRDAPAGRVRRRRALEVQRADERRQDRLEVASTPTWRGSPTSRTGRPRPPTRGSSSTRCASRSARRRSTSSRRRGA